MYFEENYIGSMVGGIGLAVFGNQDATGVVAPMVATDPLNPPDGMVIAGAYAVNFMLGITATISIIFHEIPQEIADFGVLLYSGLSKKKALFFNLLSALSAIVGLIIGLLLVNKIEGFTHFVIPFAAGNFLYIAASNLLPELHRHCKLKDTLLHILER